MKNNVLFGFMMATLVVGLSVSPLAHAAEATTTATTTAVTATTTATTTVVAATTTATTTPIVATTTSSVSPTIAALLAQLAKLTELFNSLKAQMMGVTAEIKELKGDLREGMTDADIKTIQELLASDPSIYPKGLVTVYFGPMTKEAIKKFQAKNGLEVTGEIDVETKAAMDAIIEAHRAEGKFPIGLLLSPGLKIKFEDKFKKKCEGVSASSTAGMICVKVKAKHKMNDEDEDEDEAEDEDADSSDPATLQDASHQIDKAVKEALDLRKKLDRKDYVHNISTTTLASVKAELAEAEKDIKDAKKALVEGDYAKAMILAEKAEETIDNAKDTLDGSEDKDDDDDENDEEEDNN